GCRLWGAVLPASWFFFSSGRRHTGCLGDWGSVVCSSDLPASCCRRSASRRGAKPGAGNNSPAGLYPCKGGGPNDYLYLTTSRANPEHWTRLMKLMGREELIEDARFATGDARVANSDELDRIIGEWTSQHDKREVMEKLIAVGVPAGAVFDTLELQNEPSFET